jgi:hypothetical protein
MAVKKDSSNDLSEPSLVTVSTGDTTTTSVYIGGHAVNFVDGQAEVSSQVASLLKSAGFGV